MRLVIVLICAAMLPCCGATIEVNARSWVDGNQSLPKTARISVGLAEDRNDLQARAVVTTIEKKLKSLGESVVQTGAGKYVLLFGAAISQGRDVAYSYSLPVYGTRKHRGSFTSSTGSWGTYSGRSSGIVGFRSVSGSRRVFDRSLDLALYDAERVRADSDTPPIWQAKAISSGTTGDLATIVPFLIDAGLSQWRQQTAEFQTIRYSAKGDARLEWSRSSQ